METRTISVGPTPQLELEHVSGDLRIEGWDRPEVQTGGDEVHELEHEANSLRITCSGDLRLQVPRAASLHLSFVGGDLDLQEVDGDIQLDFVGGDATLRSLKGEVSVEGVMGDLQMDNVARVKVGPDKHGPGPDFSRAMSHKAEQAARRAQRKVEQAARQVQRKAERTRQRVEREVRGKPHGIPHGRNLNLNFDLGDIARGPRPEPVSDEERMTILRMLQEKKISSEEADKLLAALEGVA
jgi:hypothetical protein